jgi:DNA-binding NarL/FixJ family response regulator
MGVRTGGTVTLSSDGEPIRGRLRVLVIDDHRAVAEAIAMAIDLRSDMQCVGVASTLAEARALFLTGAPDVLLTDVRLPDGDGVEAARRFAEQNPDLRILVLTAYADVDVMARAAAIGASGILPKESSISAVLTAVRRAGEGEMTVEGSVLSALLNRVQPDHPGTAPPTVTLTDREAEVLRWLSQGLDPQTISRRLGISVHTCRGHVKSILAKLQAHSQLEAVVKAMRLGLVREGLG